MPPVDHSTITPDANTDSTERMDPVCFASRAEFRTWLEANHDAAGELWVGYYEADADETGVGYGESVEEAVCFGWIDGIDDGTYERRFTPRKPDSKRSNASKERVGRMVEAGKTTPAGLELVDTAKESGEWDEAYRLADDHEVPDELEAAPKDNEAAWENFQDISNTDRHAFVALVEDAKTESTSDTVSAPRWEAVPSEPATTPAVSTPRGEGDEDANRAIERAGPATPSPGAGSRGRRRIRDRRGRHRGRSPWPASPGLRASSIPVSVRAAAA